jgi:uncharacterized protein YbaR (Trm112 family)
LLEARRVARNALVVTTEELECDREAIDSFLFRRCGYPHLERNLFHPDDLRLVLGEGVELRPQLTTANVRLEPLRKAKARQWIRRIAGGQQFVAGTVGVVVADVVDDSVAAPPRFDDEQLLDLLLAEPLVEHRPLVLPARAELSPWARAKFVCPGCRGKLIDQAATWRCPQCAVAFPLDGGVPVLHHAAIPDPTRDQLRARLADRPNLDAILALRDRLVMPPTDQRSWRFAHHDDRRGWTWNTALEPHDGDATRFAFRSTSGDPFLLSPGLDLPAQRLRGVAITLRIHNPDYGVHEGLGQVFWLAEADTEFAEHKSVLFDLRNDGEPHTYRIDLQGHAEWPADDRILCLRIDPVNAPAEVELVAVELDCDGPGAVA